MRHTRFGVSIICSALLIAGVVLVAPADAAQHSMSRHTAGRYYLHSSCRMTAALTHFNQQVWHGRRIIPYKEVKRRLSELERASNKLAAAHFRFERALLNPPAAWPQDVAGPVRRLAKAEGHSAHWARRMATAFSARNWIRLLNERYNHVHYGSLAETIRARLNLPPPGHGC